MHTEKIFNNVYRIPVPLPGNPMRELNAYVIRGKGQSLLIDTGFRLDACREALRAGLAELGIAREETTILLTHMHADHAGLAPEFVGEGNFIMISAADRVVLDLYSGHNREGEEGLTRLFIAAGFPQDELRTIASSNPALSLAAVDAATYEELQDGQVLTFGGLKLHCILMPGHTPGHMCYYLEDEALMFTGDHVLFDISPNITAWEFVEDSLGNYLDSLRRIRGYEVRLPLPSHRKTGDMKKRVDALIVHHERRLDEVIRVLREAPGLNAYEMAGRMTWSIRTKGWADFPLTQKWFAVGEALSHLDYLRVRGQITRSMDAHGIYQYASA